MLTDTNTKGISLSLALAIHALIALYFLFSWHVIQGSKTKITGISIIFEKGISDKPKAVISPQPMFPQPIIQPEPQKAEVSLPKKTITKAISKTHSKILTSQKSQSPAMVNAAPTPKADAFFGDVPSKSSSSSATPPSQAPSMGNASAQPNGDVSTGVRLIYHPQPSYPAEAREQHQQGKVLLHVEVGADGEPINVSVETNSGVVSLDEAAVEAVKHWRFSPATKAGIPVKTEVDIPVIFRLEKE